LSNSPTKMVSRNAVLVRFTGALPSSAATAW
jgi:hypothetical protein